MVAAAAAMLGWVVVEKVRDGHPTSLGAASGVVAGLVAVTPACASIVPWAAVLLGLLAGAVCALAVALKFRFGFDDSLDVVGVHLVGGIVGCLFIGFFGTARVAGAGGASADGLFYGGGFELLGKQALGAGAVLVYSFLITLIIGLAIDKTIGFRLDREDEESGIDLVEHAETGYELAGVGGGSAFKAAVSTAHRTESDREVRA